MGLSHIHTQSRADLAIAELLENAKMLVLSGQFSAAFDLIQPLCVPGAWCLPRYGSITQIAQRCAPLICHLAGEELPALGTAPGMARGVLRREIEGQAQLLSAAALCCNSQPNKSQGSGWSEPMLRRIAEGELSLDDKAAADFLSQASCVVATKLAEARRQQSASDFAEIQLRLQQAMAGATDALDEFDATDIAAVLALATPIAPEASQLHCELIASGAHALERPILAYYTTEVLKRALILATSQMDRELMRRFAIWMSESATGQTALFECAALEPVASLLAKGVLAESLGICKQEIDGAILRLNQRHVLPRQQSAPIDGSSAEAKRVEDIPKLAAYLAGSELAGLSWQRVVLLDSGQSILFAACEEKDAKRFWTHLRELQPTLRRWPLITMSDSLECLDNRSQFESGPGQDDVSPAALIERATQVNVAEFIAALHQQFETVPSSQMEYVIENELQGTMVAVGCAPTLGEVLAANVDDLFRSHFALDRWLLDWELNAGADPRKFGERQDGFSVSNTVIALLPTDNSWDALAYLHWFGVQRFGSEAYIALGRDWQRRYGAELWAHWGTMLECWVSAPPSQIDDAWQLAVEQHLMAPYSLYASGLATRRLAGGLLDHDAWFFHERP